jgi:hypothetical protein
LPFLLVGFLARSGTSGFEELRVHCSALGTVGTLGTLGTVALGKLKARSVSGRRNLSIC